MTSSGQQRLAIHLAQSRNKQDYLALLAKHHAQREIVATTNCPSGQILDWIKIESQGHVADPPPPLDPGTKGYTLEGASSSAGLQPQAELEVHENIRGPKGTVPIARPSLALADFSKPVHKILSKTGPPDAAGRIAVSAAPAVADIHWYGSSAQYAQNYGCQARFSMYSPFVETANDFSLIQLAAINNNGAADPNHPRADNRQTLEAGWIKYPAKFGDWQPRLFTFFTTVGYETYGDYIQSWNTDYKGWVQYDSQILPGSTFTTTSTENGPQYDLWMSYQLYNGNWWLWIKDRWIGYYPASMFSAGHTASNTLADHADQTNMFGEIFDSSSVPTITATDMGSGEFPETHWQHSAYIYLIGYQPQPSATSTASVDYDGTAGIFVSDPARYRVEPHFNSGTNWQSYMWLGGPGSGGVVGG